ncbi:MAG: hypothetical protein ACR2QZ_13715 [Woeseiaceae bacterium]
MCNNEGTRSRIGDFYVGCGKAGAGSGRDDIAVQSQLGDAVCVQSIDGDIEANVSENHLGRIKGNVGRRDCRGEENETQAGKDAREAGGG